MVDYKCNRCCKTFTQKGHYQRHINRKYLCKEINPNKSTNNLKSIVNNTTNKCPFCEQEYSNKWTLKRHVTNNCKIKNRYNKIGRAHV